MWIYILVVICALYISPYLFEAYLSLTLRRKTRAYYYDRAQNVSKLREKKLLVIGDPDTGCINYYLGRDYNCGDVCLDLTGCPKCEVAIKGSLELELPKLPTNGYVIFVSCTLEYVNNLSDVVSELKRVSGGDLFIATVEPYAPLHFLFGSTKQIIISAPPVTPDVIWKQLPNYYRWLHLLYSPLNWPFMKGHYG